MAQAEPSDDIYNEHRKVQRLRREEVREREVPDSVNTEKQAKKEFFEWCATSGPCELNGVQLPESKVVYDELVTPRKVELYVTYLLKRKKKRGDKEANLSMNSLSTLINGLSSLQKTQKDEGRDRFKGEMGSCIWTTPLKQLLSVFEQEQGTLREGAPKDETAA